MSDPQIPTPGDRASGLEPAPEGHWTARLRPERPDDSSLKVLVLVLAGLGLATLAVAMVVPALRDDGGDSSALGEPASVELALDQRGRAEGIAAEGLSAKALERLQREPPSPEEWARLFPVTRDDEPVVGSWEVVGDRVVFYPDRPFEGSVTYAARWGEGASRDLAVELGGARSATSVVAVHPAADMIPANLQALEIELSGPMGDADPLDHLALIEERGRALDLRTAGLEPSWNEDRTVLLLPLVGRNGDGTQEPLLDGGRRYHLIVERSWRDAEGRPLAPSERRLFLGRAADREAPAFAELQVTPPRSERAPVTVDFPEPFAHRSVEGALVVIDLERGGEVAGSVRHSNGGTRWTFVPEQPWRAGARYAVRLRGRPFDLAGNALRIEGAGGGAVLPFRLQVVEPT